MNKKKDVKNYFKNNANAWISDQYDKQDYSYPVSQNRIRITLDILKKYFKNSNIKVLNIGCGNGRLEIELAKLGHKVTSLDVSGEMISFAKKEAVKHNVLSKIEFIEDDIEKVCFDRKFDVIIALGVYEYLDNGEAFFLKVKNLLHPNGVSIMDFRNRLFNMTSLSSYTIKEIQNGTAINLIKEIEELYHSIPIEKSLKFINRLEITSNDVRGDESREATKYEKIKFKGSLDGTQQTLREVKELADKNGLKVDDIYGIHPHLFVPSLNRLLPPNVFNKLSDSLIPFEKLPISLIWSSKFMGVFRYKTQK